MITNQHMTLHNLSQIHLDQCKSTSQQLFDQIYQLLMRDNIYLDLMSSKKIKVIFGVVIG